MTSHLLLKIKEFCCSQGNDHTYWIGYSGGLDSHVLLHALSVVRQDYPIKLHAVYMNHRLSSHAQQWGQHCVEVCKKLGVLLTVRALEIPSNPLKSPEEIARDYRYAEFASLLAPNDILLTAHHQDDQAETVLLQMLRGAGVKGLAAMPKTKSFAKGFHARPLLYFTRDELKKYAQENQLNWIEDESNSNRDFTRNFIRHEILSKLKTRWPNVAGTLTRVAENCAEAQFLLDEIANADLAKITSFSDSVVSISKLLELNVIRQRHVLRGWFTKLNFPLPSALKLHQIQQDMLDARQDKSPHIVWGNVELRRYGDELYAMECLPEHDITRIYNWDFSQPLHLTSIGVLSAKQVCGHGLRADIKNVRVSFRQGGETIRLPGRHCHHSLKKLFQDAGVPPWERDRVPLVYVGDTLAAVVGYFIAEEFSAKPGNVGYVFVNQ